MIGTAVLLGIITFLFVRQWLQRRRLPPGPFPLPLIGNLHQLGYAMFIRKKTYVEVVCDFTKKYGSVHTFWFGPTPSVNITDYDIALDAMVKKGSAFANRNMPFMFRLPRGDRGIIASNGPLWLEQRRFALYTLRNFGLGKNIIEERIMYEFEITCEELEGRFDNGGVSIEPENMLNLMLANIMNRMLFTDRFDKKDEERFFALKAKVDEMVKNFSVFDMLVDKWNMDLPFVKQRVEYILGPVNGVIDFMRDQIRRRKEDIANGVHVIEGEGEDYVDAFLVQMKKEENNSKPSSFDEEWLLMSLLDLWTAGQETTTVTLKWAFSFLLLHPQVKSRVEEELLSITKGQRPLSLTDRTNTPYYNAVLNVCFEFLL
ncbi:unspecific monooxygenase [Ancylostoma caninum]|uniref:Unspecific monooxygenase n=1 Tax=Ancylostoma caninum TaxID=29170 RepID=A0A368FW14_ANCCA|nr:unspecific monooxygenase [Ancylostoma caninum]